MMMILGPVMYALALGSVERARQPMIGELNRSKVAGH